MRFFSTKQIVISAKAWERKAWSPRHPVWPQAAVSQGYLRERQGPQAWHHTLTLSPESLGRDSKVKERD